ncbi:MAG: enoyl-CoA hydratase/isomerase family protein [Rhizobiaceae bacterium]
MSAVHLIIEDRIAELRLDNPTKLNAFTVAMLDQLADHLETIDRRDEIVGLLVTAEGERAFCAGADINGWGDLTPAAFARRWVRDGHRIFDRLARLTKPSIAVLTGHAFGGGLELAAACDARVMVPKATLALPEASVGIIPGWSGTQRLGRLLPEPVIKEMALFGRRIDANRAHQLGFVAEVSDDAAAVAREMLERVATLSPRAVEIIKSMIHAGQGEDANAMVDMLGSAAIAASADKAEGVAAFRDKRPAKFTGE